MQAAAHKFQRYASNVERDMETLMFEMLDLIDSKTRTLRKLMKLHLNIRKVSRITNDPTIINPEMRSAPTRRISSLSVTSICNSITENLSITESTKYHAGSSMEVSDFERCPKNVDTHISIERTIEDIGEGIKNIQLPSVALAEISPAIEKVKDEEDAVLNMTTEIVEGIVDGIAKEPSDQADVVEEEHWDEAKSPPDTPEIQHPNSPSNYVEGFLQDSSQSSIHSYSMIVNLEGALNNLEGCQPGGCGVYLDSSTYRNVVSSLKTAIASYGLICARNPGSQENGRKLIGMGRSSTQPALNVNVEDLIRRKTSSSTGCEKHARRKRY